MDRLHRVLSGYVERGHVPGLVALVSRNDEVYVEALGTMAFGSAAPMHRDTIFRIASLTKPVTAAAAMVLVEDCAIRLDEPVERWLPELANARVLRTIASELDDTVPAKRAITVRDVLSSTTGIGSVLAAPDTYPIQRAIRELQIGGDGPKRPCDQPPLDEWLRNLGAIPLIAQPGERWMYHVSSDILGALIARVSGQSLDAFMRERIFEPLGMQDTSFRIAAENLHRFPPAYWRSLEIFDGVEDSAWRESVFEAGGGALLSTIDDLHAFFRMLLSGGGDVLSRASVELMTSDRLTAAQREGAELFFGTFSSWGYGLAIDIGREQIFQRPGRFGWTGGFGTCGYADPSANAVAIIFTQRLMDSPEPPNLFMDFFTTVYAGLH